MSPSSWVSTPEQPGPVGQLQGEVAARPAASPSPPRATRRQNTFTKLCSPSYQSWFPGTASRWGASGQRLSAGGRRQRQLVGIDQAAQVAVVVGRWIDLVAAHDQQLRRAAGSSGAPPGPAPAMVSDGRGQRPGDGVGGIEAVAHVGDVVDPQRALGIDALPVVQRQLAARARPRAGGSPRARRRCPPGWSGGPSAAVATGRTSRPSSATGTAASAARVPSGCWTTFARPGRAGKNVTRRRVPSSRGWRRAGKLVQDLPVVPMVGDKTRGALFGLAAAALFGASAPLSKRLLPEVSPLVLAGLLYLGAGLSLLLYRGARRLWHGRWQGHGRGPGLRRSVGVGAGPAAAGGDRRGGRDSQPAGDVDRAAAGIGDQRIAAAEPGSAVHHADRRPGVPRAPGPPAGAGGGADRGRRGVAGPPLGRARWAGTRWERC